LKLGAFEAHAKWEARHVIEPVLGRVAVEQALDEVHGLDESEREALRRAAERAVHPVGSRALWELCGAARRAITYAREASNRSR